MFYKCTEEMKQRIFEFAVVVDKKRTVRDIIHNDCGPHRPLRGCVGRIGEVAAQELYGGEVDWNYYENGKVKHTPDLIGTDYFVKSCSMEEARKRGFSWVIDRKDPIVTNPAWQKLIFVCVDHEKWMAKILGVVPATELAGRFGPCCSPTLRHKVAVWYNDFIKTSLLGEKKIFGGIKNLIVKP